MKTPAMTSFHSSLVCGFLLVARVKPAYAMVIVAKNTANVFSVFATSTRSNDMGLPSAYRGCSDQALDQHGRYPHDNQADYHT